MYPVGTTEAEMAFPEGATRRGRPWRYMGWIPLNPIYGTFQELVGQAKRSDHGEIRELDFYTRGAVCWMRE